MNRNLRHALMSAKSNDLMAELATMVDVFCTCIENQIVPTLGSPCHIKARQLVEKSRLKSKRRRWRLPLNAAVDSTTPAPTNNDHGNKQ